MAINLEKKELPSKKDNKPVNRPQTNTRISNHNPVSSATAILWWLICYPIGYSQYGQGAKGWVSILALMFTGGFAWIILLIDYIMCYNAQKSRALGEWEFFPTA